MKILKNIKIIEKKEFGPDSSKEEIEWMRSQVKKIADDIILIKHPPILSPFSFEVYYEKILELVKNIDRYSIISDLTETQRPKADARFKVKEWYSKNESRIRFLALITGNNELITIAAKINMPGLASVPYGVFKSVDEALQLIENLDN